MENMSHQPAEPAIPDLREIISAARQEQPDLEAVAALHGITQQFISYALKEWPSEIGYDRGNVIGEVTLRMFKYNFDPNQPLPEDTPPEEVIPSIYHRYANYVGRAVRSVVVDSIVQLTREEPHDNMEDLESHPRPADFQAADTYINEDATAALPDELLRERLTEKQYRVMKQLQAGLSYDEIPAQLDTNAYAVKKLVSRMRKVLEKTLFTPRGLIRVATIPDHDLISKAIREGRLPALRLLGSWYIEAHHVPKRVTTPETHVALAHVATTRELSTFRRLHRDYIVVERGTAYLARNDLHLLRAVQENDAMKPRPPKSPRPGFAAIQEIAANAAEASLLDAVLHGRGDGFTTSFQHKNFHFVPIAEAVQLLNKHRERYKDDPYTRMDIETDTGE